MTSLHALTAALLLGAAWARASVLVDPSPPGDGGYISDVVLAHIAAIPEPSNLTLAGLGGLALLGIARKRRGG